MSEWRYTPEFYDNRRRKDRLEGRKYVPGQHDGRQGRGYTAFPPKCRLASVCWRARCTGSTIKPVAA